MRLCIFRRFWFLLGLLCLFALSGCLGSQARIKKVESPTEKELRSGWRDFHTFCLKEGYSTASSGSAILFQVKSNKIIQKSVNWQEVNNDQVASECASFLNHPSPVISLMGENNENFGYLIYDYNDGISAFIVDAETISLSYNSIPKTGGP